MARLSRQEYFPALTGVRAFAAYAVFSYHFNPFGRDWFGGTLFRLNHEMYLGVNVFYVLSGFLIYYRYGDALLSPGRGFLLEYARNRFARIYPVYFLVLTLTYLWFGFPDLRSGLATYTLTQSFFPDLVHAGIPQAWTLTIEETFYFTAPLLFLLVRRYSVLAPCLLLIALAFLLGNVSFPGNPYYGQLGHLLGRTLCGTIVCFACGILLAQVMSGKTNPGPGRRWPVVTYAALLACFALVLIVSYLGRSVEAKLPPGEIGRGRDHPAAWFLLFVVFPALVALFFYGLLTERSRVEQLLGSRWFVLLGGSSYSFYLIHVGVFQQLIFDYVSRNYLVLFLLLNVLAIAMFKCFEKPLGRWLKSLPGPSPGLPPARAFGQPAALLGYAILAAGLIAAHVSPLVLHRRGDIQAETILLSEDGLYESSEAVLCLAAASLFLLAALTTTGAAKLTRRQRTWMVLLATMLLFMLGEELSWGQRLLGFRTPAWLAKVNHQGEFSVHNFDWFQPTDEGNRLQYIWLAGMLVLLGLLPLAARVSQRIKHRLHILGLPIGSMPICAGMFGTLVFHAVWPDQSEVLELAVDLLLAALSVETFAALARNDGQLRWRRIAMAGVPTLALALTLWVRAGQAELPTVTSLKLADQGRAAFQRGQREAALDYFRRAIDFWPQNTQAHFDLADALLQLGRRAEARPHLEAVVRQEPKNLPARTKLAALLVDLGEFPQAALQLRQALGQKPDSPEIASNLAWILATCKDDRVRDGKLAVELAQRACQATGYQQPLTMNALAAAYAEVGRYQDAVAMTQRAYELARAKSEYGLAARIRDRQQLYLAGQPYRIGQ
jgi:peptidoglycan/LPS O-acetylase OafA/YrhL